MQNGLGHNHYKILQNSAQCFRVSQQCHGIFTGAKKKEKKKKNKANSHGHQAPQEST